ncbi:MAG: 23S rRNA (pseudouridine(1915)-N(3))-methyltransferase RlmH [Acetobacteraceae bacterium]|nr:23S rRNA (pseudouridine(1915)-N(3))-methyltransferase RlmH [Acetobacteraceae bacterium]
MRIVLLLVGRVREGYLLRGMAEYRKRLGAYAPVDVVEVAAEPLSGRPGAAEMEAAREREGQRLLARVPAGAHLVALDPGGKELDSLELASVVKGVAHSGTPCLALAVGGAFGLAPGVLQRAALALSLSRLTFPHQLVPLLVLEQLYRAFKIIRGEPYHW